MITTLVFDLDDTISFCHDRVWENAKPNVELIRKINKLYNDGFNIHIHSSRGELSGTDYTTQVRFWLEDNGVLFHHLQFGKPLGILYVDDKAISPEAFMQCEIEKFKGWSGSTVIRIGNSVHKDDPNIASTVQWYEYANNYLHVPEVKSVLGNHLVLEYIKEKRKADPEELEIFIKCFAELKPINNHKWDHYIRRVESHCAWLVENLDVNLYGIVLKLADLDVPPHSFSHGDFTPDNTIVSKTRKEKIYLIDPLNVTYSSWKLDEAKLNAWKLRESIETIPTTLSIAETIRTLRYAPQDKLTKLVNLCTDFLKN
jgi:hypothetical protein